MNIQSMTSLPDDLRDNVRLLGELLGDAVLEHQGPGIFRNIERIRALSKELSGQSDPRSADHSPLIRALGKLPDAEVLPVARAFNQFLNLANIADMQHFHGYEGNPGERLGPVLEEMCAITGKDALRSTVEKLRIELVLTAHPTEITRRTLIHKYEQVSNTLSELNRHDLPRYKQEQLKETLRRVVAEIWHTEEIRETRPTAIEEAKWGFAVIENSLWKALPVYLRHLEQHCLEYLGQPLPVEYQPFRFYSWMGGDRDGNPNVTHEVTRQVILLGRWQAADLYTHDLNALIEELSFRQATDELLQTIENNRSAMPYRDVLKALRKRLAATMAWTESSLEDTAAPLPETVIGGSGDLLQPLLLCRDSLLKQGLTQSANGPLLDLIRKVHAFGINLLPLDIRQHSESHSQLLNELTEYLEMGSYLQWDEDTRCRFLLEQLQGRRPLIPTQWPLSPMSAEVLATCRILASQPRETLSHYVISMATSASDVLAVALLLKESGLDWPMPIVPLFETLDDLEAAPAVMQSLWQIEWYRNYTGDDQTVMIGYSDSAKDAGKFTATWAQYNCQEKLVALAAEHDISLNLFHGRGGTIGRGGGPVEKAIASQPPGSVQGRIRVTEQGEMIRYKFGLPDIAFNSLGNYLQAILQATVAPANPPSDAWRSLMDNMAKAGLEGYRSVVQQHPGFVPYFRSLTPEQELNKLALGSRPAKRKADGGVESLRAIPWVFAWTQVRLNLPGWLGTMQALQYGQQQAPEVLADMLENWPFFSSFIDLVEMVLGKCDSAVCAHYEAQLVPEHLQELGASLRADLEELGAIINSLKQQNVLLADSPLLQQSIAVRKPYVDPLNYLQAELLKRERTAGTIAPELSQALLVTMSGIAAGMRNTG